MAGLSSTKYLAKRLGLLKRSSSSLPISPHQTDQFTGKRMKKQPQIFKYLVVLDFESTCWKNKDNGNSPEVIEFPVVLLNLQTGEIEDKFHYYVQPTEHKKLSAFCTELTGIQQDVVDNGIPIGVCLRLFSQWLQKHIEEKQISFPSAVKTSGDAKYKAVFATWTDWDLNTCLQYECKRKGISYSSHLKTWIDLRKTFRTFYQCNPQGLNGALQHVGIKFEGREHSGIDDATNTAYLVVKMVADGCIMKATKSLIVPLDVCNSYGVSPSCPAMTSDGVTAISITSIDPTLSKKSPIGDAKSIPADVTCTQNKPSDPPRITITGPKHTPVAVTRHSSQTNPALTVTPPLCHCGKRCKRKKVVNPGPNTGRVFYSCPAQRSSKKPSEECKFFKWESTLGQLQKVVIKKQQSNDPTCKTLFNVK